MLSRFTKGVLVGVLVTIGVLMAVGVVSAPDRVVLNETHVIVGNQTLHQDTATPRAGSPSEDTPITETITASTPTDTSATPATIPPDEDDSEPTATPSQDTPTQTAELNTTLVARLVHQHINEERADQGLSTLEWDQELSAIATDHSQDMVARDFFAHTNPDGQDFSDRYSEAGYECRVETEGSQYLTGAENILFTYYEEPLEGSGDTYYSTPEELAAGIVNQWMNSEGHRENILTSEWESEGIGIAVTEDEFGTKVYAVQNFC